MAGSEVGIGFGSHVEVQQIIPATPLDSIFASFLIVVIIFLGILIILQVRGSKTKLYNPKTIKSIRVKIHE